LSASPLRDLPAVHALLADDRIAASIARHGRSAVVEAARGVLEEARAAIRRGDPVAPDPADLAGRVLARLASDRPALRPVINATGVLLHTGLGRAPLAAEVAEAVARVARGYCSLEFDLDSGRRGRRASGVAGLIGRLTGAEAAEVVNNNAAATVLALRALAAGREVIVSRGQLVEIGGSFRLPEIFAVSGARLREVGTTNRTRLADYERAIGPETAALLRVHASNYRIVGFAESVGIAELAALGRSRGLWTIDDIGSGALAPGRPPGAGDEPTAAGSLAAGADLVLFSGDKLLGGPQCGILAGRSEAVARISADPLMRAVRVDKMTIAALEATLRLAWRHGGAGGSGIPLWESLATRPEGLLGRAERLAEALRDDPGLAAEAVPTTAFFGGGSVPAQAIPSAAVRLSGPFPAPAASVDDLARRLRLGDPAVVPRVHGDGVLLDLRAVPLPDDARLLGAIRGLFRPDVVPACHPLG
jgi:L-seryl-tRNA(Ser) seleniumtransferase